jgi:hypothetical protein
MFAFDEVPKYKVYLGELLYQKGFFENSSFKTMFENGNSLNDFYSKTKEEYSNWLTNQSEKHQPETKYSLENYRKFFDDSMFYINIPHFIRYLETTSQLKKDNNGIMIFKTLGNAEFLISEYYYTHKLEKSEYKTCGKLYNKLKSIKLEDALLYEMAMNYLKVDAAIVQQARKNITEILNQKVEFDIQDIYKKHVYKLVIPFNKIDSYVELLMHKEAQEKSRFKSSYLVNIVNYMALVSHHKDIKPIYEKFDPTKNKQKDNKYTLLYDELNKLNAHLISKSILFTSLALCLEKYFIFKNALTIKSGNRITIEEISDLKIYFDDRERIRNRAFHFGVPEKSYDKIAFEMENKFLENEVKPLKALKYDDLKAHIKSVCSLFLDKNHNNYFEKSDDGKKKRKLAEQKYFETLIAR